MEKISKVKALEILQTFTHNIESVMLSTVNEQGLPFASYAPFAEDAEHNYYIGISRLVEHTHNLLTTQKAHLLFIEDESNAKNIFFRQRFYGAANVYRVDDESEKNRVITLFGKRFGESAEMIMNLPDFHIFRLSMVDASFVLGFGAAYSVSNDRQKLVQKTGKVKN